MPAIGESLRFTVHLELDVVVVKKLSQTSYIVQSKDGVLYAIHFFSNEDEAKQMKQQFDKIQSLNILRGYMIVRALDQYLLAAPLPPKVKRWKNWLVSTKVQPWQLMYSPLAVMPEKIKLLIRGISEAICAVHNVQFCHGNITRCLLIGDDNSVLLIPRARNETIVRIQSDVDEYETIVNQLFNKIPGGQNCTKFEKEIFNGLCSLGGAFSKVDGHKSKRNFARIILTCPLDWMWTKRSNFMARLSVEKTLEMNRFTNICHMNTYPAQLQSWQMRIPSKSDSTPLYRVFTFKGAPVEYMKTTGFVEFRKNLDGHARDYEPGITPEEVEDIFYYRWPDLVFKLYYSIVLAISQDSIRRPFRDRLLRVLHQ